MDMPALKTNIQRILKRMDRSISGPLVEFSEQFLYGHREILMTYAGFGDRAMLTGSIEHGWAMDSGYGIRKVTGGRYLYLSWSAERMARSEINSKTTISIGAPFIYAHELVAESLVKYQKTSKESDNRKYLFFPAHGNEYSIFNAENQIKMFKENYDPELSTVCLYWVEFVNPEIFNKYRQAGFNVVCSGFSGQMEHTGLGYSARKLAGSPIGGRPTFLLNTIALLATHEIVVAGGLGTICFYSAYMDKELEILRDYNKTEKYFDLDYEKPVTFSEDSGHNRYRRFISDEVGSEFDEIDFSGTKFRKFAKKELGQEVMKSKEELHRILKSNVINMAHSSPMAIFKNRIENFDEFMTSKLGI